MIFIFVLIFVFVLDKISDFYGYWILWDRKKVFFCDCCFDDC